MRRVGIATDSSTISSGTPTMVAAQMTRYSLGLRRRSARAISRARFAPKSRCSTTLLSWASASLDWSACAMPAEPDAASGFSTWVDA